jgi:hypothetical protein
MLAKGPWKVKVPPSVWGACSKTNEPGRLLTVVQPRPQCRKFKVRGGNDWPLIPKQGGKVAPPTSSRGAAFHLSALRNPRATDSPNPCLSLVVTGISSHSGDRGWAAVCVNCELEETHKHEIGNGYLQNKHLSRPVLTPLPKPQNPALPHCP